LIAFNKPYGVICQFTETAGHTSLKSFIPLPNFYPAGRLDADSEGLVLLTDDGKLQNKLSDPDHKLPKIYWVEVEGLPTWAALEKLRRGVTLNIDHKQFTTRPAQARHMETPPQLWPRQPPVRVRASIPTAWLELTLFEGKNRQVRRMTAAVGLPTLRLIRYAVGEHTLADLPPGKWREVL